MFNKPSPFTRSSVPSPNPPASPPQLAQRLPVAPPAGVVVAPPAANDSPVPAKPPMAPAAESTRAAGSQLIVGPEVKLKGAEILDCDTLVVEGRVEATMDSRVIRIAERGAFEGKVGIDVAEVHGQFDGELTARVQLVIHATGRVRGVIRYGSILIEKGGIVSGDVRALDADAIGMTEPVRRAALAAARGE